MTAGEAEVAQTVTQVGAHAEARVREPRKPSLKGNWWRHIVALIAVVVALFPVVFIVSSAFNRDNTLSGAQIVPTHVTLGGTTYRSPLVNLPPVLSAAGGTAIASTYGKVTLTVTNCPLPGT